METIKTRQFRQNLKHYLLRLRSGEQFIIDGFILSLSPESSHCHTSQVQRSHTLQKNDISTPKNALVHNFERLVHDFGGVGTQKTGTQEQKTEKIKELKAQFDVRKATKAGTQEAGTQSEEEENTAPCDRCKQPMIEYVSKWEDGDDFKVCSGCYKKIYGKAPRRNLLTHISP